jgi:hypothetical protein
MLIKEFDLTTVDSLGDFLSDLMGTASLNHVQSCPTVLRLGAGRGTDEQIVLQLTLQAVLFDMVGHGNWNHPESSVSFNN